MPREITPATSLENLRKEAKRWLKALRAGEEEALARFGRAHPAAPARPGLRDVQHALAREYGRAGWADLKKAVEARHAAGEWPVAARTVEEFEHLASDFVLALDTRDDEALRRVNACYRRSFTHDDLGAEVWRRVYAFRQRSSRVPKNYLQLSEAQTLIAQDVGFQSWAALTQAIASGAPPIPAFEVDAVENRVAPRRLLGDNDWDHLIAAMKERKATALDGNGQMTDAVLARIADLEHVTTLNLGGSRDLTDDGLRALARMPQLRHLVLSEYPGGKLSDRGLEVLRHLSNLRMFEMTWQRGVSDAGVAHLKACEHLEQVNLMGSPTGDGALEALQGKPKLRQFSSGKLVTDAGLRLLKNFPLLAKWDGPGEPTPENGGRLLIDGPFTDDGLAELVGLAGVCDLDLFWHVTGITSAGIAHLVGLPNLRVLGADGKLSDDAAMRHFAAMPRLSRLRVQETVATDEGFESLSRSKSIEFIWGRQCPNFGSRGLVALSKMPALRGLGVSCKNVDDAALATLPLFPSLRELTPIDVQDDGFVHVGRCTRLERLTCMYCRETTDVATEHIAGLGIKYYYAGLTKITDRSLEVLGRMTSLEQVELYECNGVTDAGLPFLAGLPHLREIHLDSLPGVTLGGTKVFPALVRVKYTT